MIESESIMMPCFTDFVPVRLRLRNAKALPLAEKYLELAGIWNLGTL
jgi:hypothetical protein